MEQREQLETLAKHLDQLVSLLALDPMCSWRRHFESCLSVSQALLAHGFTPQQLNELSGSVMSVFGGAGSFNDYAPIAPASLSGVLQTIPGMEAVDALSGKVYQSALVLRVVS